MQNQGESDLPQKPPLKLSYTGLGILTRLTHSGLPRKGLNIIASLGKHLKRLVILITMLDHKYKIFNISRIFDRNKFIGRSSYINSFLYA